MSTIVIDTIDFNKRIFNCDSQSWSTVILMITLSKHKS